MGVVLMIHSLVRYAILVLAIAGVVLTLVKLVQRRAPAQADMIVASTFLGFCDLQMLLGLLVILLGGLVNAIHPVVMFIAIISAHALQTVNRRASDNKIYWPRLAFYVVPLAIILVGLAAIRHLPV